MARRRRKKAQGLPLTTIIIAAIGMIVLVVMVAIFTGRIGGFGKDVETAQTVSCSDACVASGYTSGGRELKSDQPCKDDERSISFRGARCCCIDRDK